MSGRAHSLSNFPHLIETTRDFFWPPSGYPLAAHRRDYYSILAGERTPIVAYGSHWSPMVFSDFERSEVQRHG